MVPGGGGLPASPVTNGTLKFIAAGCSRVDEDNVFTGSDGRGDVTLETVAMAADDGNEVRLAVLAGTTMDTESLGGPFLLWSSSKASTKPRAYASCSYTTTSYCMLLKTIVKSTLVCIYVFVINGQGVSYLQ